MTKTKRPVSLWIILLLTFFITCVVTFLLTVLYANGAFIPWRTLKSPPSGVNKIIQLYSNQVWVETNQGQLLTAILTEGKWSTFYISELPNTWYETSKGDDCTRLHEGIFPLNPFGKVLVCQFIRPPMPDLWTETYLALMKNGSMKYWSTGGSIFSILEWILFFSLTFIITFLLVITAILYSRRKFDSP